MNIKDLATLDQLALDKNGPRQLIANGDPTETIELKDLLGPDLTASASFNLTWIKQAALGRLLESVPVPALLVDEELSIVFCNSAVLKIANGTASVVSRSFSSIFVDPDEGRQADEVLRNILTDRKPKCIEGSLMIFGHRIWGRMLLRSLRVQEKRLILVMVEDLTAEKKQLVLYEKYKRLVHNLPQGVAEFAVSQPVATDLPEEEAIQLILRAVLVDGNPEFAIFNGSESLEQMLGRSLGSLFPFEGPAKPLYRRWFRRGFPPCSSEVEIGMPDGRTIYLEYTLMGIVKGSNLYGLWLFERDVTENHKMKEDAFRAQKLESLAILAGGIAHDFNNSLTAILGNINLAKIRCKESDPIHQRLMEAEKACERARCLTAQLQAFSKARKPVRAVGPIGPLLEESVQFALRGAKSRPEFSIPSDLWPVEFDEGQVSQMIHNLVINADQAMPDGGIINVLAENISLQQDDILALHEGRYVRFSFSDNGVGIAPDNLARIFDPYYTTKKKGSGLGLATSYSIVKGHGGHIVVISRPTEGSTFQVYLPASERDLPTSNEVQCGPTSGKGRILVMEDEKMVREVAQEMLSLVGYDVECVSDGSEAIDRYRQAAAEGKPFAAVIMNLTVPGGMGARDALRILLKIDPDIKAVLSSGYPDDPVMGDYAAHGFKGVICKPYNLEEIHRVIHSVLCS